MNFAVYWGSGRATCRMCKKIIGKHEMQVNAYCGGGVNSYQGNVHLRCLVERGVKLNPME